MLLSWPRLRPTRLDFDQQFTTISASLSIGTNSQNHTLEGFLVQNSCPRLSQVPALFVCVRVLAAAAVSTRAGQGVANRNDRDENQLVHACANLSLSRHRCSSREQSQVGWYAVYSCSNWNRLYKDIWRRLATSFSISRCSISVASISAAMHTPACVARVRSSPMPCLSLSFRV